MRRPKRAARTRPKVPNYRVQCDDDGFNIEGTVYGDDDTELKQIAAVVQEILARVALRYPGFFEHPVIVDLRNNLGKQVFVRIDTSNKTGAKCSGAKSLAQFGAHSVN